MYIPFLRRGINITIMVFIFTWHFIAP